MAKDNSWLNERGRAVHITIRDVDCDGFDVESFIKGMHDMGVTFFSFFAGGYVTTYPTALECQRVSPYLKGRDLTGDIINTAHKYGMKAAAMIDLGQLPKEAGDKYPQWCARDSEGNPYVIEERLYATCPNSGFRKEYAIEMVKEILGRYDVDCVKFGGGSYGFLDKICYCESCCNEYHNFSNEDIPPKRDWADPAWRKFFDWQMKKTAETVKYLVDMVKSIEPDMPVMGNSVCFGDPNWTMKAALDMEVLAKYQDAVQVEVQTRLHANEKDTHWQSLTWPAETANFMTHATDKPVWVVASYFLGWPWRRSAMTYAEQKVYYAQMVANGAIPMVNLSGGPMDVHEDKRGFKAIEEIYHFMRDNQEYYEGDQSLARVAVLYSQQTLNFYGQDEADHRYIYCIRGIEQALQEMQIPFDLISSRSFVSQMCNKYDTVILPNMACMTEKEAQNIREFVKRGGNLIATFETSVYDEYGYKRDDFLLADLFSAHYQETEKVDKLESGMYSQAYMEIEKDFAASEFLKGIQDTTLIASHGKYCRVKLDSSDTKTILTLGPAFQVFPEGFSYPMQESEGWPMLLASGTEGMGKVVYFAGEVGKSFWQIQYSDFKKLICNAVEYCEKDRRPIKVKGPKTLLTSSRQKKDKRMVHLINLTGGWRLFDELIPLYGVEVGVPVNCAENLKAYLLSDKKPLDVEIKDGYATVIIPELKDYDVVVFEV